MTHSTATGSRAWQPVVTFDRRTGDRGEHYHEWSGWRLSTDGLSPSWHRSTVCCDDRDGRPALRSQADAMTFCPPEADMADGGEGYWAALRRLPGLAPLPEAGQAPQAR